MQVSILAQTQLVQGLLVEASHWLPASAVGHLHHTYLSLIDVTYSRSISEVKWDKSKPADARLYVP